MTLPYIEAIRSEIERRRVMTEKSSGPLVKFCISIGILLVSVFAVSWVLETQEMSKAARVAIALVPPAIYVFNLIYLLRLISNLDEFLRRIHLEALAIAFTGVAVAIMACEYMRKAGLISSLKPDYVLIIMMVLLLVGYFIAWRRYQ
jgi:hypothetical protein